MRYFTMMIILQLLLSWGCTPKPALRPYSGGCNAPVSGTVAQVRADAAQYGDYGAKSYLRPVVESLKKGRYDTAIQQSDRMLSTRPDSASIYFLQGVAYQYRKDYSSSIQKFSAAIRLDSRRGDACFFRAVSYKKMNNPRAALQDIRSAIYNPDTLEQVVAFDRAVGAPGRTTAGVKADILFYRAMIYYDLQKYDLALNDCKMALETSPEPPGYYHGFRGMIYFKRNQYDLAYRDFEKTVQSDSSDVNAWNFMGAINLFRGHYDEAMRQLRRAAEIKPDDTHVKANMGLAYWLLGDRAKASDLMLQASKTKPDAVIFFHLAYFYHAMGNPGKARAYFRKARELNHNLIKLRASFINKASAASPTRTFYEDQLKTAKLYLESAQTPAAVATSPPNVKTTELTLEPDPVPVNHAFKKDAPYLKIKSGLSHRDRYFKDIKNYVPRCDYRFCSGAGCWDPFTDVYFERYNFEKQSENHKLETYYFYANGQRFYFYFWGRSGLTRTRIPFGLFNSANASFKITSLDYDIVPWRWEGTIAQTDTREIKKRLASDLKNKELATTRADKNYISIADSDMSIGRALFDLGYFDQGEQVLSEGVNLTTRYSKGKYIHSDSFTGALRMLAHLYAAKGNFDKYRYFLSFESQTLVKRTKTKYPTYEAVSKRHLEMANEVLFFTGDKKKALEFFWLAWDIAKKSPKSRSFFIKLDPFFVAPNLAAILLESRIDFKNPDNKVKRIEDIPEYRDFRGLDDRYVSRDLWERWLSAQCKRLVDTVKNYPNVNNRVVVAGETKENFEEKVLDGFLKDPMGPLVELLATDTQPWQVRNKNVYAKFTEDTEKKLTASIMHARKDSLLPCDVVKLALDAAHGSYPLAVMTAHAVLKRAAKEGRVYSGQMIRRAGQGRWDKVESLRYNLRPYSEIAKRLRSLRPQGDFSGDKMGPWYHIFVILTAGAMENPGAAKIVSRGEHLGKWINAFGKAEGSYNKVKCTIDFKFADEAAGKLGNYGRFIFVDLDEGRLY